MNNKSENNRHSTVKGILKGAIVLAVIALVSFSVNAQDLWEQFLTNNSYGKMANMLLSEVTTELTVANTETASFYIEPETDEDLDIEAWMTNNATFSAYRNIFSAEEELSMEVEAWMTSDASFGTYNKMFNTEEERPLEIEAWMTSNTSSSASNSIFSEEEDLPLNIEPWMTTDHAFNSCFAKDTDEELELEAWMTNDNYWSN